jgi:predicted KAP-like P-loop ATPase
LGGPRLLLLSHHPPRVPIYASPPKAHEAAKKLGQQLSSVQLEKQRHKLEEILRESGKRVVVTIDDIDRLDRAEIHAMFKLVKLGADFERITYVLAFDDEMVAAALGERFSGGGTEAGRAFLEKIIQVPLHLPPADKLALRKIAMQSVDETLQSAGVSLSEDEARRFVKGFTDSLESV